MEDCVLQAISDISEGKSTEPVIDALYLKIESLHDDLGNDDEALKWFNLYRPAFSAPLTPPPSDLRPTPLGGQSIHYDLNCLSMTFGMTGGLVSPPQSCYNSPALPITSPSASNLALFSPSRVVKPRDLPDSTDYSSLASLLLSSSLSDLPEDEEKANASKKSLSEPPEDEDFEMKKSTSEEEEEEEDDPMIVFEKKSSRDSLEEEEEGSPMIVPEKSSGDEGEEEEVVPEKKSSEDVLEEEEEEEEGDPVVVPEKKSSEDSSEEDEEEEEGDPIVVPEKKSSEDLLEDEEEEEESDPIVVPKKMSLEDSLEEEEEEDPINVTEKKSLEDLSEDEEGGPMAGTRSNGSPPDFLDNGEGDAMNVDADFSVQMVAAFEPRRSSRNALMKDKLSFKLLSPPKVTKSKAPAKPTPRMVLLHVSVQIL
jgi:hypothetical protein